MSESERAPEFEGCQVVRKLRSGPIADYYHAMQKPLGRSVLIKALSSSILPSSPFAATLEREAQLLAELHHPNILHIHDFVRRQDRMWLVLEYVDGWSLEELLKRLGQLSVGAAVAVALEVARALEHAHEKGIVHRDVQPRNVLISSRGHVKLVNFTVAVDERLPTAPELLDGSASFSGPAYMSPEQILGEPADPRSDLFSLGVVLYEMLAGARPFDGPDDRSTTQRIRHDAPKPLSRAASGVPGAVERIVQRCLEKLPSDRFFSASELLLALNGFFGDAKFTSSAEAIFEDLSHGGLSSAQGPPSRREASTPRSFVESGGLLRPALGLGVGFLLILLGGAGIQLLSARTQDNPNLRRGSNRLELKPDRPAYLRVVADPWAHVIVDGQQVETTPFARPIPLKAGTHYVRLEHPNAQPERRTVRLVPGETVLLDVKMNIAGNPAPPPQEELEQPPPEDAGDAAPSP